jgi:hypothetical protein
LRSPTHGNDRQQHVGWAEYCKLMHELELEIPAHSTEFDLPQVHDQNRRSGTHHASLRQCHRAHADEIWVLAGGSSWRAGVGMTVTTTDDRISRWLEVRAPRSSHRLKVLAALHEAGVPTFAFVGQLLPHSQSGRTCRNSYSGSWSMPACAKSTWSTSARMHSTRRACSAPCLSMSLWMRRVPRLPG